jgi:hypothetical protein
VTMCGEHNSGQGSRSLDPKLIFVQWRIQELQRRRQNPPKDVEP